MAARLRTAVRDTKRLAELLAVLARHGFGAVAAETGLDGLISRSLSLFSRDADPEAQKRPQNVRIRMMLEELGPTFIKMGQILATRPDLIPVALIDELKKLQDDCPTVPFADIRAQLDAEFEGRTDEIFTSIDETPLAAASMAQAHRAVLRGGTPVVVKILRPGIESVVDADMVILHELAKLTESYFKEHGFSPVAVVREFSRQLRKEVNLSIEARSTDRLARHFADNPHVSFPTVYPDASTRRVLTLEAVGGQLLSRVDPTTLGIDQRRAIVEHGTDAVFEMCLELGFFHADPHPGNIFVHDDGSITFIDCGMTGHVEQQTTVQLAQLVQGVVGGNARRVIQVSLELSGADPTLEFDRQFRADVSEYVAGLRAQAESLEDIELGPMLEGFFDLLRTWQIVCPSDLVFLIKALATIEGVGEMVDPTFHLVTYVRPKLEGLVRRQYGPQALSRRVMDSLAGYIDILEDLPSELRALVSQARRNDFAIKLDHLGADVLSSSIDRASRTVAYSLVLASVVITAGLLVLADRGNEAAGVLTILGFLGLAAVAAVVATFATLNLWRWWLRRRKKRRRK